MTRVLILGGYGNFGSHIARSLAPNPNVQLVVAGRSLQRAASFAASLGAANPAEAYAIDVRRDFGRRLREIAPGMVIHTVGPFQGQDYAVAQTCIDNGVHYVDLADGRAFVAGIDALDVPAREADVLVVAGASSVPCLTAAIIDEASSRFAAIESVDYGISAAQQTNRGLATAAAVLSYVGQPFATLRGGASTVVYGWQDLHGERYLELGLRLFGNCDIPDLELFPKRYPSLRDIRFCAGHEIKLLHLGTWILSWGVRLGVLPPLGRYSSRLLKWSFLFDPLGSSRSGFHMALGGKGRGGRDRTERFFIIARQGHGPYIPCTPAIILAERLANGQLTERGARPCLDLIGLDEFLGAIDHLDISIIREVPDD
ncbi:saccharopine dehydrogenase NADP-binding domain-containing protein [Sphingomonas flavescens]|uniref:saccharopine dehydrogenase NADP-binding domain-containing protein n=1 Tax=Sphingomonas flavescens TaxID=3132797 RepID=UPI002804CB00|nr:saccharopine dehydrogenase NADP-binding domain-containing protein [Sphingomonas limnosediminicola]